ncbi:hypothetical protein K6U06_16670 [Acidiferrimicrobium sp. IK]|uniref:hypothetical protein n=1 Tax=Acidiferrimicrobium sp. IK TaxID=2871700 RepID=UPI0021CB6E15|nr:hypothetical protein [Acidiferrimicrobium sp. IK]MCU4186005.1 hypothetical protein [Acidiferrimicrobium sp. IK]
MGADDLPGLRRVDRWSMRWRLGRIWKQGMAERRAARLDHARRLEGSALNGARSGSGRLLVDSELYLSDGASLAICCAHVPTFDRLLRALREGPVLLERVADHRRFIGLYFQTRRGPLAMLVQDLAVRSDGGGLRRTPTYSFA